MQDTSDPIACLSSSVSSSVKECSRSLAKKKDEFNVLPSLLCIYMFLTKSSEELLIIAAVFNFILFIC